MYGCTRGESSYNLDHFLWTFTHIKQTYMDKNQCITSYTSFIIIASSMAAYFFSTHLSTLSVHTQHLFHICPVLFLPHSQIQMAEVFSPSLLGKRPLMNHEPSDASFASPVSCKRRRSYDTYNTENTPLSQGMGACMRIHMYLCNVCTEGRSVHV